MNSGIQLTERQLELIALVASGLTIEQAAPRVHLAQQSTYNVLSMARSRAGASTLPHLVAICLIKGLIVESGEGTFAPSAP